MSGDFFKKVFPPPPLILRVRGFCLAVILFFCSSFFVFTGCGKRVNRPTAIRHALVNGETLWHITSYTDTSEIIEILIIEGEKDTYSRYYFQHYTGYNDDFFVYHQRARKGTPIGNNWYTIVEIDKAWDSEDESRIFYERKVYYKEKIIFELLDEECKCTGAPMDFGD